MDNVIESLIGLSGKSSFFLGLVFAGSIAMAALQVFKELTPIRRGFQKKWYEDRLNEFSNKCNFNPKDFEDALNQLYTLSVGGFKNALYDLPSEELGTQMGYAVQGLLDNPKEYDKLIRIMSFGVNATELQILTDGIPPAPAPSDIYYESRNRVSRAINRNLEGINLSCSNRWKFWMNFSSISITVLIVISAVVNHIHNLKQDVTCNDITLAILVGFVGGYLAPITRDLLQVVQSFRK